MSGAPAPTAARLRGAAAGLLTASLTLAAHGAGGGVLPAGAAAAELLVVAVTVGALASALPRASDVRVMLGLLAAGQFVGHLTLGAAGHTHGPPPAPAVWTMALAHLVATGIGAVLITVGDRLCRKVSRVLRAPDRYSVLPMAARSLPAARSSEQPLLWTLLLAASMSHRGPPVSLAR